ncbi:MAG: bifunctional phosphoglucose/phosphomannose isomerase [Bacteroidota bacterium]|nr:bifunctional phosphoglucose/phosphomannose isomerase [Bacteroidota bacterium]MDP4231789.1 bifunctional phosphoglucose/phosphomannose isomerase [Bacteroidota bacterium]MDP4242675.1 bifunctional phosphoglucose/phosphomannose isomerase [Bacteroidota bacterium]MDP4287126.1 bifunctional phosphoglucose/phosphomannose isomerase [Bacteroidota bacterium]
MSFTHRLTPDDVRRIDQSGMTAHIAAMGSQIRESIELTNAALSGATLLKDVKQIIVCGMGGSAIGGDFVRSYLGSALHVPFAVNRSYELPAYADAHTLIIASSYSGNTEETLAMFDEASRRKCPIVCISTGGELVERAKAQGILVLPLHEGLMPRAAFAYSFVPVLLVLDRLGFTSGEQKNLEAAATLLDTLAERYGTGHLEESNPAFQLAGQFLHRIPVIYSASDFEAVCLRWRGQMEENAKHLAFGNVLPEMNHNEIEGWSHPADVIEHLFVIILRAPEDENPRIQLRFAALSDILRGKQVPVVEIKAEGTTRLERMLSLIAMADWTSLYLALFAGTDPTPIQTMEELKKKLSRE